MHIRCCNKNTEKNSSVARQKKEPGIYPAFFVYRIILYPMGNMPICGSSGRNNGGAPSMDGSHDASSCSCGRITRHPLQMSSRTRLIRRSPIGKRALRHNWLAFSPGRTKQNSCAAIGPPSTVSLSQYTVPPVMRSPSRTVQRTASRPRCNGNMRSGNTFKSQ